MPFEPNRGQAVEGISYVAHGTDYSIALMPTGAMLTLNDLRPGAGTQAGQRVQDVLGVQFAGASPDAALGGAQELPGHSNYFLGGQAPLTDIPQYGQVVAHDVWQGVDVVYQGDQGSLRFDLDLQPGAEVSQVALHYVGAQSVALDEQGQLVLHTPGGDVVQKTPTVYTEDASGTRQPVNARYDVQADGTVGFQVDPHDPHAHLVIDPTLIFSTYLGGDLVDQGNPVAIDPSVAVDALGQAYVAGFTQSSGFPTAAAYDSTLGGTQDGFVTAFKTDGSGLLYSTFLGGGEPDEARGVAVSAGGNAYLTGQTSSGTFPTTAGAYDTTLGTPPTPVPPDAFVLEMGPTGSLIYSTFLGGNGQDLAMPSALT